MREDKHHDGKEEIYQTKNYFLLPDQRRGAF